MKINKLNISELKDNEWVIDTQVFIDKERAKYWELETKKDVEDFMASVLSP